MRQTIFMMKSKKLAASKAFICCSNMVFMMSGFALTSLGVLLMLDSNRVLMSRLLGPGEIHLDQPLFYYLSFGIVGFGFVISVTGLLGCWASCLFNRCITALYVTALVLLLLGQFTFCILAVFFPHFLGVDVRPARLIRALQRNYAVPGREQFTAALDLAQTMFSCCGINGSNNYGTSWWRLQEIGRRDLVVPLTCCTLNTTSGEAFLNPVPGDLATCQTLNPAIHQRARHHVGCSEMIEEWAQNQAFILLTVSLTIMIIEICALLSTLLACTKTKLSEKPSKASTFTSTQTLTHSPFSESEHDYGIENRMQMTGSTFGTKS